MRLLKLTLLLVLCACTHSVYAQRHYVGISALEVNYGLNIFGRNNTNLNLSVSKYRSRTTYWKIGLNYFEKSYKLDDVACLSSDYRFYMNIGGSYHCLKFLNFQQVTVNLNLSTDLLFKVATVSDYFSMNSEGRMSFVGQVREALETASAEMKSFNEIVRSEIIKDASRKHVGKTYYSGNLSAFSRYTN